MATNHSIKKILLPVVKKIHSQYLFIIKGAFHTASFHTGAQSSESVKVDKKGISTVVILVYVTTFYRPALGFIQKSKAFCDILIVVHITFIIGICGQTV